MSSEADQGIPDRMRSHKAKPLLWRAAHTAVLTMASFMPGEMPVPMPLAPMKAISGAWYRSALQRAPTAAQVILRSWPPTSSGNALSFGELTALARG